MQQKQAAAITFAALALLTLGVTQSTQAANHNNSKGERHRQPPQEILDAIKSEDYATWKELVSEREHSPFADFSEEQFQSLVEIHELHESGDHEAAREIAEELGLERHKQGQGHSEEREAIHEALEQGDYETFKSLISQNENAPHADITEAQFNALRQAHELRESGDHEGARELLDEAGIERPEREGKGFHKRGKELHRNPEAIQAIESGDYQAFREALSENEKALEQLTEEKFEDIVEKFNNRPQRQNIPQTQPQA